MKNKYRPYAPYGRYLLGAGPFNNHSPDINCEERWRVLLPLPGDFSQIKMKQGAGIDGTQKHELVC